MKPWWERSTLEIDYEPLQEGEIRLIEFDSPDGPCKTPLGFRIKHVNINDPPPYCALSYRWPNGKELDEPAKFRDHWLDIRGGPLAAVRAYLSNPNAAHRHLPFWIDQFCIQQSNVKERGQQVPLMGAIYSNASATIIFLGFARGPGNEDHFRSAFDYLREINHISSGEESSVQAVEFTKRQTVGTISALAAILSAPWFSRTWVVQEAVLSSNAVVLCGSCIEDMLQLCTAISHFDRMGFLRQLFRDFHTMEYPWQMRVAKVRLFHRLELSYFKSQLDLSDCLPRDALKRLLTRCRPLEATDGRDKIFALAGICRTEDMPVVDYSLSEAQVYYNAAARILKKGHSHHCSTPTGAEEPNSCPWNPLCLLALVNADKTQISSPSWVPDWSLPLTYNDLWFEAEEWSGFHASGRKEARIEIPDPHPHMLIIEGKVCSVVSSTGEDSVQTKTFYETDLEKSDFSEEWWTVSRGKIEGSVEQGKRLPMWILEAGKYLREHTDNDPLREEHISRTLCAGARAKTAPALNSSEEESTQSSHYSANWKSFQQSASRILGLVEEPSDGSEETGTDVRKREEEKWAFKSFLGPVGIPCRGRRLFVTADGHIGLGPGRMREGDVVSVLYGAHWPFILRPHGDAFLLVGYCYVDGMMHGEMLERDDILEQQICLV